MKRYLNYLLLLSLIMMFCLFFLRNQLPSPKSLSPLLNVEPLQTITDKSPFYVPTKDFRFYIEPVYEYTLHGLVVSKYNARKKYMARIDRGLNITDICVVWGENAFSGIYQKLSFWSGEFTCFARFDRQQVIYTTTRAEATALSNLNNKGMFFSNDELSNNHLLVQDDSLGKQLRDINIGDQISLSGYLVNYGASANQIYRQTSVTRTDTGNGACETVYVTSFMKLKSNPYRQAFNVSLICFCFLFVVWLIYQIAFYRNNTD